MQGIQGCALYRHRLFRADGICLFCNPDASPETLGAMLADQGRQDFYYALHQGKECHMHKCMHAGQFNDGLGHWWCKEHVYQCLFMRAGAAREWERWPAANLSAGRPAWHARCIGATTYKVAGMLAILIGVDSGMELESYVEEYVKNALGQRESVVAR